MINEATLDMTDKILTWRRSLIEACDNARHASEIIQALIRCDRHVYLNYDFYRLRDHAQMVNQRLRDLGLDATLSSNQKSGELTYTIKIDLWRTR